jgi:hypothetical protein
MPYPEGSGHPGELRWADPDNGASQSQREIIIAIANQTGELIRIADALEKLAGMG